MEKTDENKTPSVYRVPLCTEALLATGIKKPNERFSGERHSTAISNSNFALPVGGTRRIVFP